MALRKSTQAALRLNAVAAMQAAAVIPAFAVHTIVAGQFAAADVLEMIAWPAGTVLHSLKAKVEDLDSNGSPTITLDFGVLTGEWLQNTVGNDGVTARACGNEFGNDLNVGQAGGSVDVAAALLLGMAPSPRDRSIGFKVETGAATLTAGAKIYVSAEFLPAPVGVLEV